ncbi:protein jag [Campylobacter sp. MG1]|uniref:protein jag n=1 Tax=Campylobacter sp. MG1 TaxID=2976332 RepID=UPI00226CD3B0|nr:protein jag [Campylobacter sp. MG1]
MRVVDKTLEDALIKASKDANCSVRELEYEIIQYPSKGFLGFFKKDAIIDVNIKKQISKSILDNIVIELKELFCNDYFSINDILVTQANENSVNVEFICDTYENIIGKDAHKYKSLDIIVNHYINIKYSLYARVEICGVLANLKNDVEKHLNDVRTKVKELGKAQTRPLEISLLNLIYEEFLTEFSHKNVVIKDSSVGRYIAIYGDYKK